MRTIVLSNSAIDLLQEKAKNWQWNYGSNEEVQQKLEAKNDTAGRTFKYFFIKI